MEPTAEEKYQAAYALHFHGGGIPAASPEVAKAERELSEIIDKHRDDLHWSRDTRRAVKLRKRVIDQADAEMVALARSKGLLPHTKGVQK